MVQPIHVNFSKEGETKFKAFLKENLRSCIEGLREIHETKLPSWRRVYESQPLQRIRNYPFPNASNLVVPIVAIHADTLVARLIAAIYKLRPIWPFQVGGDFGGDAEPLRMAIERYLTDLALEPEELDLYRVYREFLNDVVQYGTSVIKCPWETQVEAIAVPSGDGTGKYDFIDDTVYDGPRPEKVLFEDLFIPVQTNVLKNASFKAHRVRLNLQELESRFARELYARGKENEIYNAVVASPDASGPTAPQKEVESKVGAQTIQRPDSREWYIYECWCLYGEGTSQARLIACYHYNSGTLLRSIFSFFPDEPWIGARLFPRDGSYYGYGLAEKLSTFQEETSQIHNQRRDAQTVANAKMFRVSPNTPSAGEGFDIYPGAHIPAEKDDIEAISHGEPSQVNIDEERLSLDLADKLSGVSPPMQGFGAGTFTKRGVYTAMGTLSLLQEGNTRTDMHISDIRTAHLRLGRVIANEIAYFGTDPGRFASYGKSAEHLRKAFDAIKNKTVFMPVLAATASLNRELEKQADIMLVQIMMKHYGAIAAMIGQAANQMVPPEIKNYLIDAIRSADSLMKSVLRNFGQDEPTRLVPEARIEHLRAKTGGGGSPMVGQPAGASVPGVDQGGVGALATLPGMLQQSQ